MSRDEKRTHSSTIRSSILMSFIVLIFLSTIILFAIIIMDVNEYHGDITSYIFEAQTNAVFSAKSEVEILVNDELKDLSSWAETTIRTTMDLDKLEDQLNRGEVPEELINIFDKYFKDVYLTGLKGADNNIFICTNDKIIYDQDIMYSMENGEERTWEYEIETHTNKELAKATIYNLLNQTGGYLVFERSIPEDDFQSHKKYNYLSDDRIKEIISKEGLKGLKNYTFLIPVYITEDGDIFGKKDVIGTCRQDNNKFIVVQEYNLYDYIMANHSMDEFMDTSTIYKDYIRLDTLLKVFAISDIMAILCTILFSASLSNSLYDSNEKNATLEKHCERKDNESKVVIHEKDNSISQ